MVVVDTGLRELGYTYVNIDDCWSAKDRDPITYRLVADPIRFPNGIKSLAAKVHDLGLKVGLSLSRLEISWDTDVFADWHLQLCWNVSVSFWLLRDS